MTTDRFNPFFLAKVFTSAYAFCYMAAPLSGLYLPFIGVTPSQIVLFAVGVGLIMTVHTHNTVFITGMAAFEALGCVLHFFELLPWVPQLNTNGYLLMSMLDLAQCIFLFVILEYKQLEKIQSIEKVAIPLS